MNDRRLLAALALVMAIAIVPNMLIRRQVPPAPTVTRDTLGPPTSTPAAVAPTAPPAPGSAAQPAAHSDSTAIALAPADTVVIRSRLYRYTVST
ncbi:MAG: hypothetical protein ACREK8_00330, partial [Gemmatimonadales bacterium]